MRNGSLLSRAAALLVLAALAWFVWAAIEAPMLASVARDRRGMAEAQSAMADAAGASGQIAVLRSQQARVRGFIEAMSWNLDRGSPELLSAQLQRAVDGYAAASGATVASSRTVPAQTGHGLATIALDFDIRATLPGLQSLLWKIDQARPRIFIDRLTVQTAEGGEGARGADGQVELAVQLNLSICAASRRSGMAL
jgi:hypothetical protein